MPQAPHSTAKDAWFGRLRPPARLVLAVLVAASLLGADNAEQVRDLQTKFRAEREAAVSSGIAKKFAPENLRRADELAKKGDAALAAGRLLEAREAFHEARQALPALPADFPEHVIRILGNPRLRHGAAVEDLAFTADGGRLVTASGDGIAKIWEVATGASCAASAI